MQSYGIYSVSVTDTDGCTTFSSPVIYTGILNINSDGNISIYPNPLQVGSWKLEVGSEYIGAQLEILDFYVHLTNYRIAKRAANEFSIRSIRYIVKHLMTKKQGARLKPA